MEAKIGGQPDFVRPRARIESIAGTIENPDYAPFDTMIVFGRNWSTLPPKDSRIGKIFSTLLQHRPQEDPFHLKLSKLSRINAIAAGIAYTEGVTKTLLFTGGKTAGSNFPSEAQAMANYMRTRFPLVPLEAVIVDPNSYDTVDNIKNVKGILKEKRFKSIGIISDLSQWLRIVYLSNYYDLPFPGDESFFPSHQLLSNMRRRDGTFSARHSAYEKNHFFSEEYRKQMRKDARITLLIPHDDGLKKLNKWITPRVRRK